jgi:RNA polymerase sigma factor (sigma-70 family)
VEDIEQDLVCHLERMRPHYDAARSAWPTFARSVIENHALSLVEHAMAAKRYPRTAVLPFDGDCDPEDSGDDELPSLAETLPERTHQDPDLAIDVDRFLATLPEAEQELCIRVAATGISEAARELMVSRETVRHRLRRLRVLARRAGLEKNLC